MSTTTDRISQIQLVLVPSTDQDRSLAFYEAPGFAPVPATFWFRDPDGNALLIVGTG
jgi:hypothetical protein